MYKIYAGDLLIYDDTSSDPYLKVVSPVLSLELGAAGSLKMTIPPGNAGYDAIERMITDIRVEKDGVEIWAGRPLQEDKNFWNQRVFLCEGELAFLNDTTQPQEQYVLVSIRSFLEDVIAEHNSNVPANRQFTVGAVTVSPSAQVDCVTDYEKTIESINKCLIEVYGGHLSVRKQNGVRYLDYLEDTVSTNTQTIEFGKNLMDFSSSFDSTEYATVIVPLGKKLESEEDERFDRYLTVETLAASGYTRYVTASSTILNKYGWIEKIVHFDDIDNATDLYLAGREYLNELQFDTMELSLSAFDLHYLNPSIEAVEVGDRIRVVSPPHGLDKIFPVMNMEIPLDSPQNTAFTLGDSVKMSLTEVNNKTNEEILRKIKDEKLDGDAILEEAQENAAAIMDLKTNGFITITTDENGSNELYVSETRPYTSATRYWRWNMNGLGYTDDGGETWKTAMLMDGSILGERIAAGSIHGSKITAGTLALTTAAGEEACTISLATVGLRSDEVEIGSIDSDGTNIDDEYLVRMVNKRYMAANATGAPSKIKVTGYSFRVYRYSDNTDPESGFVQRYGPFAPSQETNSYTFEIPIAGYYRVSVWKTPTTRFVDSELPAVGAAIDFGSATVVSSADIRINGMVTFSDLRGTGRTTVIDGGNITTGTIAADYISLYGMHVEKLDNDGQSYSPKQYSFIVDNHGNISIDAAVSLSSSSVISFAGGTTKTLGDLSDEAEGAADDVAALADGTYSTGHQNTFIDNKTIYSPTIIADTFYTVAESVTAQSGTASFIMQRTNGSSSNIDAFRIYYFYNQGWEAHLYAENQIVNDTHTIFLSGIDVEGVSTNSTARFTVPIVVSSSNSYGSTLPQSGATGQLFFKTD